eukprot:CAMPEP_0196594328 /NCGR_PEP_ID=MMETSP1081-20130531/78036_1 /TAXON_ID=36882 /ORGANISM="Pyramimonas amylifera, Strain CCMP720" /LENGTH=89 /DNA_ID=CAMNT_0041918565 /DNA_START=224 /DNA_END=490 /DNA_ORIENTATION=-
MSDIPESDRAEAEGDFAESVERAALLILMLLQLVVEELDGLALLDWMNEQDVAVQDDWRGLGVDELDSWIGHVADELDDLDVYMVDGMG